jgi:hypothetical protein
LCGFAGLQALQAEGSWREAERHFCEAKEWKAAVAMYRQQGSWEDALRVAKVFGGLAAAKQVCWDLLLPLLPHPHPATYPTPMAACTLVLIKG